MVARLFRTISGLPGIMRVFSFSPIGKTFHENSVLMEVNMDFSLFLIFVATTLVVVASPGAAAIAIASQGAGNGLARAQSGIFGVASANAALFAFSATGISSIILASDLIFQVIKWLGVAYLSYLGLRAIFSKSGGLNIAKGAAEGISTLFAKGFVVEFTNPKALLFFAAILPQFLDLSNPILPQILVMGVATAVLDIAVYTAYAWFGASLAKQSLSNRAVKLINTVAGSALLLTAFRIAKVTA